VEWVEDPVCELPVADRPSGTQCTDFCTQVAICGDGKAIEVSFDIQTYWLTKVGTNILSWVGLTGTWPNDPYFWLWWISYTHTDASGNNWFVGGAYWENSYAWAAYHYALDPIGNFVAGSARKIGTTELWSVGLWSTHFSEFFWLWWISYTHTDASGNNWFVWGAHWADSNAWAAYHYALDSSGNFVAGSARSIGTTQLSSVWLWVTIGEFWRWWIKHTHTDASGNNWFVGGAEWANSSAWAAYHYALDPIGNFVAGSARSIGTTQLWSVWLWASQYLWAWWISYTHTDASGNNWFVGGAEWANSSAWAAYHYALDPIGNFVAGSARSIGTTQLWSVWLWGSQNFWRWWIKHTHTDASGNNWFVGGAHWADSNAWAAYHYALDPIGNFVAGSARSIGTTQLWSVWLWVTINQFWRWWIKHTHTDASGNNWFVGGAYSSSPIHYALNIANNFVLSSPYVVGLVQIQNVYPWENSQNLWAWWISYTHTDASGTPWFVGGDARVNNAWAAYHYRGNGSITQSLVKKSEFCDLGSVCVGGSNAGAVCTGTPGVCTGGGTCEVRNSADCQQCQMACASTTYCPAGKGTTHDIVAVVDRSGSMLFPDYSCVGNTCTPGPNAAITRIKNGINSFLQNFPKQGSDQVSIVSYATTATTDVPLQTSFSNYSAHTTAVNNWTAAGRTNLTDALKRAYDEITGPDARDDATKIVIVFTDGEPNESNCESPRFGTINNASANDACEQAAIYRADQIKNAGWYIYSIFYVQENITSANINDTRTMMQTISSNPNNYYFEEQTISNISRLNEFFWDIGEDHCGFCPSPLCGNGTINAPEICDDGKHCSNGTACSSVADCPSLYDACIPRDFWTCNAACTGTDPVPFCGNSTTEAAGGDGVVGTFDDEECDLGTDPFVWNGAPWSTCSQYCKLYICGNNVLDPGEECDDGDTDNTDSCKNDCTVNVCGDGVVNEGMNPETGLPFETCDLGALNGQTAQPCTDTCQEACLFHEDCESWYACETWECKPFCGVFSFDVSTTPVLGWSVTVSYLTDAFTSNTNEQMLVSDPTWYTTVVNATSTTQTLSQAGERVFTYRTTVADSDSINNVITCQMPLAVACSDSSQCPADSACMGPVGEKQCQPVCTDPDITDPNAWAIWVDETISIACNGAAGVTTSSMDIVVSDLNGIELTRVTDNNLDYSPTTQGYYVFTCQPSVVTDPETWATATVSCMQVEPVFEAICGNGAVEWTEQCDDGNTDNNDWCNDQCEPEVPTPGVCGWANGNTYAYNATGYAPDLQCATGTPSSTEFPTQWMTVTWTCSGLYSGATSADCSASRETPPVCGSANQTYPNGSTDYGSDTFCNPWSATPVTPAFPTAGQTVTWTCTQPQGGDPVNCSAFQASPDPVNGVCGWANGNTYTHDVTSYGADIQCVTWNPSTTDFPAAGWTVTWSCDGLNGWTTESGCSASRDPAPVCGWANGNTYAYNATGYAPDTQCTSGTPSTTDFPDQWWSVSRTCSAPNGWPTVSCSASRALPPVCGSANQTYPNGSTDYGSDTFCNPGSATPTTPAFPTAGQTVTWTCTQPQGGDPVNCECNTSITWSSQWCLWLSKW
jgi:cysteine-rich repeat protein